LLWFVPDAHTRHAVLLVHAGDPATNTLLDCPFCHRVLLTLEAKVSRVGQQPQELTKQKAVAPLETVSTDGRRWNSSGCCCMYLYGLCQSLKQHAQAKAAVVAAAAAERQLCRTK
jgi:hypothetical protein